MSIMESSEIASDYPRMATVSEGNGAMHETTVQPELDIDITEGTWKMDPSLKQRWVTALRSGKYKQGRVEFKNAKGEYCVLGVLCEVGGEPLTRGDVFDLPNYTYVRAVTNTEPQVFWQKNDDGWTFNQLANFIESNF